MSENILVKSINFQVDKKISLFPTQIYAILITYLKMTTKYDNSRQDPVIRLPYLANLAAQPKRSSC